MENVNDDGANLSLASEKVRKREIFQHCKKLKSYKTLSGCIVQYFTKLVLKVRRERKKKETQQQK